MGDFLDAVLLLSRLPASQLLSFESAVRLCRSCVQPDASVSSALALLRSGYAIDSLMCAGTGLASFLDWRDRAELLGLALHRWVWFLLGVVCVMVPATTALFINGWCLITVQRVIHIIVNMALNRQVVIARQQREHGQRLPGEPLVDVFFEELTRRLVTFVRLVGLLPPVVGRHAPKLLTAPTVAKLHSI